MIELFQSTLPTRGSDAQVVDKSGNVYISIHAPHEGERRAEFIARAVANIFQSTLPTRGSDEAMCRTALRLRISIHAPHEGERRTSPPRRPQNCYFNPRSPRGGATDPRKRKKPT